MSIARRDPRLVHRPTGLYSLVSIAPSGGRLAVASGQTGRRADGSLAAGAGDQAADALSNLRSILNDVGADLGDVLILRWFVVGKEHAAAVRAARDQVFRDALAGSPPPSSTMAIVDGLVQPGAAVEVEAWFVVGDS